MKKIIALLILLAGNTVFGADEKVGGEEPGWVLFRSLVISVGTWRSAHHPEFHELVIGDSSYDGFATIFYKKSQRKIGAKDVGLFFLINLEKAEKIDCGLDLLIECFSAVQSENKEKIKRLFETIKTNEGAEGEKVKKSFLDYLLSTTRKHSVMLRALEELRSGQGFTQVRIIN